MKKKKWLFPVVIVGVIAILWFGGVIPKQIAKAAGTSYVKKHFPEMQLVCAGVEYADVYGDYLISFTDKDGKSYRCVIGPTLFPCALGQGLFAIEDDYATKYIQSNGSALSTPSTDTFLNEVADIAVSYGGWTESLFLGCLNLDQLAVSSVCHLPIYKFDTLNDLQQFKQRNRGLAFDGGYDEVPSFNETVAKYDDAFFEKNSLILVYVPSNSGTYRYGVNSVSWDGGGFCVHVEQINDPESYTTDMAGWFITMAVSDSTIEVCPAFDADLNSIKH